MKVAVIGSGSWGTALSCVLADAGHTVSLVACRQSVVDSINKAHTNPDYLQETVLSSAIVATTSYKAALCGAQACVVVPPSQYLRETAQALEGVLGVSVPVVICSKGVETDTGALPIEAMSSVLGNAERFCVLSGPTHAEEVVRHLPTSAVCASTSEETAVFVRDLFSTDYFRTYTSHDVVGVELCGAFKNVIAIAVGLSYGIGFGDNTAAMLITRGLAEMSRMVVACGGDALTCMGLAGTGDMVVTCTSRHSRNRRFGEDYLAQGRTLADFEADTHMVVEGALACKTLRVLSQKYDVELPLTQTVRNIVWNGAGPRDAARTLLERPLRSEF